MYDPRRRSRHRMEPPHFSFDDLFHADEYLYFLEDTLREENTPAQVDFVERALALSPLARVLDLGCGHGRHAIELARRGHRAVGIDLVEGFLEVARKDAAAAGVDAQFAQGDVRAFRTEVPFDGVVCLFDVLGFFGDEDNETILRNAFEALAPGGRLLLDLRTREHMMRIPNVSVVDKGNGDLMVDRVSFDVESGRLVDQRTFVRGGAVRSVSFSVRLYAYTEMRTILRALGFHVVAAYGGYDGAPLSAMRPRTLIVAEKPGG
jgi:SAM-dependent methyltransferase